MMRAMGRAGHPLPPMLSELGKGHTCLTQTLALVWETDLEMLTPACSQLQVSLKRSFGSPRCSRHRGPGPLSSLFGGG